MLLDARIGVGRRDGHRIGLVRQVDVVDISPLAGEKTLVLDPLDRLPDAELGHSQSLQKNSFLLRRYRQQSRWDNC